MTAAFLGIVILSLARDIGNRFTTAPRAPDSPTPKGSRFDRSI